MPIRHALRVLWLLSGILRGQADQENRRLGGVLEQYSAGTLRRWPLIKPKGSLPVEGDKTILLSFLQGPRSPVH